MTNLKNTLSMHVLYFYTPTHFSYTIKKSLSIASLLMTWCLSFRLFMHCCYGFLQLFLYLHMLVCLDVGLNTIVSVTYNKQYVKIKIRLLYSLYETTPIFKGGFLHFKSHLIRCKIWQTNLKFNPGPGQFL